MKKKEVLHIVEDLNIGGLERVIESIVIGLNKNKYNVQVWCLAKGGEIAEELIGRGINLKILGMKSYYNPTKIVKLSNHLRKSKIDIIHTHGYFASTFARMAAILARTPVILTHIHTAYYGFRKRNILIERFLSIFTDKIICVSNSTREFVEKIEGIDVNKTCLIYNGTESSNIHTPSTSVDRTSLALSPEDFVIITVASLMENKGHHHLLDAINILSKKYRSIWLLIVGDGPLRSRLEEYAKSLKISSRIVFTGLRKDVHSLLYLSDLFILCPIEREGLGVSIIEAMSMGIPVIGTSIGGIPELIENQVNGLLVPPCNSYELAVAIEKLFVDKDQRIKMAEKAKRKYEQNFTALKMVKHVELLYDGLSKGF